MAWLRKKWQNDNKLTIGTEWACWKVFINKWLQYLSIKVLSLTVNTVMLCIIIFYFSFEMFHNNMNIATNLPTGLWLILNKTLFMFIVKTKASKHKLNPSSPLKIEMKALVINGRSECRNVGMSECLSSTLQYYKNSTKYLMEVWMRNSRDIKFDGNGRLQLLQELMSKRLCLIRMSSGFDSWYRIINCELVCKKETFACIDIDIALKISTINFYMRFSLFKHGSLVVQMFPLAKDKFC